MPAISDRKSLLQNLQDSPENQRILQISQQIEQQTRISALAQNINANLGYGGLMGNFQDYLLKGDDVSLQNLIARWRRFTST